MAVARAIDEDGVLRRGDERHVEAGDQLGGVLAKRRMGARSDREGDAREEVPRDPRALVQVAGVSGCESKDDGDREPRRRADESKAVRNL